MNRSFPEIAKWIVEIIWRRRYLIFIPLFLAIPISLAMTRILPRVYISQALLLLNEPALDQPFAKAKDQNFNSSGNERLDGLTALLKSNRVLDRVMDKVVRDPPITKPNLRADWRDDIASRLNVQMLGTNFLQVELKGSKPNDLGNLLGAITSEFMDVLLTDQGAPNAGQFLIDSKKKELEDAKRALDELDARILAEQSADVLTSSIDEARRRLSDATLKLGQFDSSLKQQLDDAALQKPDKTTFDMALAKTTRDIDELGTKDTAEAQAALAAAKERLAHLTALQPLITERADLNDERLKLEADYAALKQKADQHQDLVEEQTKLHARVAAASAALQDYSSRFSRLSTASTKGLGVLESPERIKLIDMASNPTVPSDSGARIMLTGIAAGVALALGMAVLAELMDQRVRRAEDVADVLDLPSVVKLR